jgi:hypothetical protein
VGVVARLSRCQYCGRIQDLQSIRVLLSTGHDFGVVEFAKSLKIGSPACPEMYELRAVLRKNSV